MPALLKRSGPVLAVGGLAVLNVVLIGALALRTPEPVASAAPAPVTTPSPVAAPSASPSASPSPSASTPAPSTDGEPASDPAGSRVLAASSARVAWRSRTTRCGVAGTVEVTTDGGRSWRSRDPGIGSVVRLKTFGTSSVFAIGADDQCRATYAWTTGPGQPWQHDRSLVGDIWYRRPAAPDTVHAPGGRQSRPCGSGLASLAGLGTYRAAVLCQDGRIRTDDAGRSWRTVQQHSRALALNADDTGFVAVLSRPGCDGVVVRRFDETGADLDRASGTCRTSVPVTDSAPAVAVRGRTSWVWAGSTAVHW